jgi:hypothetical protein
MGRPRKYPDDAARKRAQREREKGREEIREELPPAADEPLPERVEHPQRYLRDMTPDEVRALEPKTPQQEQQLRDYWGYSKSNKSTKAERDAAARVIIEQNKDRVAFANELWGEQARRMPPRGKVDLPPDLLKRLREDDRDPGQ